jgi:hypothetical protein
MKLRDHLIIGVAAAVTTIPLWGLGRAFLFLGVAVLIDADHYWDYLWRSKFEDWSSWRMFRYYKIIIDRLYDPEYLAFSLLHTAEVFLAIYLLARYWNYDFFITIFAGMCFHLFLDMLWVLNKKRFFVRAYSIIEYFIRKNLMIRRGLNPDGFYKKVFELSK